jgi:hypothetical protein
MSELRKIGHILPTKKNAETLLGLTSEDLLRAGASPGEVWKTSDPENTPLVEAQVQRLRRHSGRYLGVIAGRQYLGGTIEGFTKFNTWNIADQITFEDEEEAARLETVLASGERDLRGKPLGVFALHAASALSEQQQLFIAHSLVDEVIMRHPNRELRVGLHESDPMTEFLVKRRNFESTGKYGHPLETAPSYETQLYVRPADVS